MIVAFLFPSYKPNNFIKQNLSWKAGVPQLLTLILLTWRIWWAPNNVRKWQMGFNSAFKGLKKLSLILCKPMVHCRLHNYTPLLFEGEPDESSPRHPILFFRCIVLLSYLLHIGHPSNLAWSGFPTRTVPHTSSISLSLIWLACNYFLK